MSKLAKLLNEKLELKSSTVLTDLIKNTDPEIIADLVNSKKKDDRISIAANPNLTIEQLTKLANDKISSVQEAVCYNPNLTPELVKHLLDNDNATDRAMLIAKYSNEDVHQTLFNYIATVAGNHTQQRIVNEIFSNPYINLNDINTIIEKYPESLTSYESTELLRSNKNISPDIIHRLFDFFSSSDEYINSKITLLKNQSTNISEEMLKTLDWHNDENIKGAILGRKDVSEDFIVDVITASTEQTQMSAIPESRKSSAKILNALLKLYTTFDTFNYHQSFTIFNESSKLDLDADNLVKVVKKLLVSRENSSSNLKILLANINFPDKGLDGIPASQGNIPAILGSPNIDLSRAKKIIMNTRDSQDFEQIVYTFAANKKLLNLDDETKKYIFKNSSNYFKHSWLNHVVSGDLCDAILDKLDVWKDYFASTKTPKWDILNELSKNENLTKAQRKRILDLKNSVINEESAYDDDHLEKSMIITKHDDADFVNELLEKTPSHVWEIWTAMGSTYFQYSEKMIKVIDKVALSTPNAPINVLVDGGISSYSEWVKYNNKRKQLMSDETALKYLLHFISTGSDKIKELLLNKKYIDDKWLSIDAVREELFLMSGDSSYAPEGVSSIFFL